VAVTDRSRDRKQEILREWREVERKREREKERKRERGTEGQKYR
jgi:hypothetical protein